MAEWDGGTWDADAWVEGKEGFLRRLIAETRDFLDIQPIPGPQGERGEKGDKGDTGDTGERGPQGIPGISPVLPPNYNGWVNVREFGAHPNTFIDAYPGIMAAIDYACSPAYGGKLYVPAGDYVLSSPLPVDYTNKWSRLENQVQIVGDGITQTRFFCWGGGGLTMTGNAAQPETHFHLSGMRFIGSGWGIGIKMRVGAYCRFDDVLVDNFATGSDMQDIEQSLFTNFVTLGNGDGLIIRNKALTTDPNSLTFVNHTNAFNKRGMTFFNANAAVFQNGSFQYNGDMALDPIVSYAAKFVNPGSGYGNVSFTGTIFEGNAGCADIWWHADGGLASLALMNASAIRVSGSKYTNHNLWITGNSQGSVSLSNGTTFKGFGTYVPSATRKYWHNDNPNVTVYPDPSVIRSSPTETP